jgi:DNA-binding NarL/FixJ family response regulator
MGLQMPDLNGIEATRELARTFPMAVILVRIMFDDYVFAATSSPPMRAGAAATSSKAPNNTRSPEP